MFSTEVPICLKYWLRHLRPAVLLRILMIVGVGSKEVLVCLPVGSINLKVVGANLCLSKNIDS